MPIQSSLLIDNSKLSQLLLGRELIRKCFAVQAAWIFELVVARSGFQVGEQDEGQEDEDHNDDRDEDNSNYSVSACVSQVLPDYVSWLTGLRDFDGVSEHLEILFELIFLASAIISKQMVLASGVSLLSLKSNEASDRYLYLFLVFGLEDLIYFLIDFLQLLDVVVGNAGSALCKKIDESAIIVSELHRCNFALAIEVVEFFWQ